MAAAAPAMKDASRLDGGGSSGVDGRSTRHAAGWRQSHTNGAAKGRNASLAGMMRESGGCALLPCLGRSNTP